MKATRSKTLLSVVTLLILGAGAFAVWRAMAFATVPGGYDDFDTPDDGVTQEELSLPAGFFTDAHGHASLAGTAPLGLKGGNNIPGFDGDTVIERTRDVDVPGFTPLRLFGLRLVGTNLVTAEFDGDGDGVADHTVSYTVSVRESPSTASTGNMNFADDGTFSSAINIHREYTFTAPDNPDRVFDSGSGDAGSGPFLPIRLSATGDWEIPTTTTAVSSSSRVIIRPRTERDILASHGVIPATPSPTPVKTIGVIDGDVDTTKK